jgi:hypothetical protein
MVSEATCRQVMEVFAELGLLNLCEQKEVLGLFDPEHPFADSLRKADTIHVHIRVEDVFSLPHDQFRVGGGEVENGKDGYIKYRFADGVNMIFSSINVAQEDLAAAATCGGERRKRPFVDHLGIDLRQETAEVRKAFDEIGCVAKGQGWAVASQGAPGKPVYCCHVQVAEKHWAYPPEGSGRSIPLEFAFGPLVINPGAFGCDLRPARPGSAEAQLATANTGCCGR